MGNCIGIKYPKCLFCNKSVSNDRYICKIYHYGKYHGRYICSDCIFKFKKEKK